MHYRRQDDKKALTHVLLMEGKEARRQERSLYHPVALGLPAAAVQVGSAVGETARRTHADPTRHHQRSVAVHQDTQTTGDILHNLFSYLGLHIRQCLWIYVQT